MKLIIAIIRPWKLEAVQAALHEREVCLTSVSKVFGDGPEPGCTGIYRGAEFRVLRPKLRLEIVVDDWLVEGAVEAVVHAGSSGDSRQVGEDSVCVLQLDEYVASGMANDDRWLSEHEAEDSW